MKTYLLPETVRDAVLNYLVQRPYAEVAQGVAALQRLEEVPASQNDREPSQGENAATRAEATEGTETGALD